MSVYKIYTKYLSLFTYLSCDQNHMTIKSPRESPKKRNKCERLCLLGVRLSSCWAQNLRFGLKFSFPLLFSINQYNAGPMECKKVKKQQFLNTNGSIVHPYRYNFLIFDLICSYIKILSYPQPQLNKARIFNEQPVQKGQKMAFFK